MQHGDRQLVETGGGLTDERRAEIVRQPQTKNGQGQSGDHLVAEKPQAYNGVDRANGRADEPGHEEGQCGVAGGLGGNEGGQGAGEGGTLYNHGIATVALLETHARNGELNLDKVYAETLNGRTSNGRILGELEAGEGTAGKLLSDEALYERLVLAVSCHPSNQRERLL